MESKGQLKYVTQISPIQSTIYAETTYQCFGPSTVYVLHWPLFTFYLPCTGLVALIFQKVLLCKPLEWIGKMKWRGGSTRFLEPWQERPIRRTPRRTRYSLYQLSGVCYERVCPWKFSASLTKYNHSHVVSSSVPFTFTTWNGHQ